jgi:hypothetical protein
MRNMSFALTTDQVLAQTKTVTRRLGWLQLRAGDYVQAVKKCMGLRPGEKLQKLCVIQIVNTYRQRLDRITQADCALEGFPHMTPAEFVEFFCKSHKGCTPETIVTCIEFCYPPSTGQGKNSGEA